MALILHINMVTTCSDRCCAGNGFAIAELTVIYNLPKTKDLKRLTFDPNVPMH